MITIECITDECGNQYLPHFVDTPLFAEEDLWSLTKRQEQLLMLYKAIADRENYWYTNKPTAFGNPEFSMASGIVTGMVAGLGWDYQEVDGWINLFHNYEKAMDCARILSLTKFPIAIIREPMQDAYGEWHLEQTHSFVKGECHYKDEYVKQCSLHAKFYLDAGEWLNPGDDVQINSDMEVCIGEEMG